MGQVDAIRLGKCIINGRMNKQVIWGIWKREGGEGQHQIAYTHRWLEIRKQTTGRQNPPQDILKIRS